MSIFSGPEIANNGLVFSYDMSNTQKSWEGAPTTNLHPISGYITWPTQTLHFWEGNSWVVDSTYTNPGVPGPAGTYLGIVRKYTSGALSATWSGNSYAYVLKTAPMTAGQSYAMSAYTYLSSDCNIDGMHSSIEGATVSALSGGYVTSYNMSQKGSWQRQGLQGTASGNVNFIIAYPNKIGVTNGVFTGSILVGGAQVEFGTFPTPYTDNSRSTTQAILDLTGVNTVTAPALTYATDNTFSFNGTTDYFYADQTGGFLNNVTNNFFADVGYAWTVSAWFKFPISPVTTRAGNSSYAILGNGGGIGGGETLTLFVGSGTDSTYGAYVPYYCAVGIRGTKTIISPSPVNTNTWNNAVVTWNGTAARVYFNGIDRGAASTATGAVQQNGYYFSIGQVGGAGAAINTLQLYEGSIGNVQVYNRALSAVEVFQNFEALRGRYNI